MTYWIKNISWVEQPRITCYINWKDLEDRDIKPNEVIEVVSDYYKDKLTIWKVVDKPKSIFLHTIAILIYWAIINEVAHIILQILAK